MLIFNDISIVYQGDKIVRVDHFPRRPFVNRGVYYFDRHVPKALQARVQRVRVVLCLHTWNEIEALNANNRLFIQLDMAWNAARLEALAVCRRVGVLDCSI